MILPKRNLLLDAFKKGFEEATKTWGKDLPDISKQTYDAVVEKFDKWKKRRGHNCGRGTKSRSDSRCGSEIVTSRLRSAIIITKDRHSRRDNNSAAMPVSFIVYSSMSRSTLILFRCQISSTYSWIVRSEENFPECATFKIALFAQFFSSLYASITRFCAST